ncbi:SRPBCC domain-containing protein [Parenemella sanctibonifatiensis]|uniref:Polyketide cyclase n=1 Tax=Parenemella sanctibonifatiensis TaxID=2016505 RepID=A0A255ECX5_9ACTN|nr:SRPBCC domain-containing protein [Parenemella sanctibonifatiensis]OYN88048.1 polyketide cyclase [Parenemella sanctibonifatiensis]OYN89397.1 polyketide cyclase [Parenemella sanctibonifatiensis]
MADDTKKLTVTRTINAPAAEIYDLLTNPHRHSETDASGMVRSLDQGDRLAEVGQVFRINMHHPDMGDYQMDNTVSGLQENKLVAWKPANPGEEPYGLEWAWSLESTDASRTEVTLTYDWSSVTDPKYTPMLPAFDTDLLEGSLATVAAAVEG